MMTSISSVLKNAGDVADLIKTIQREGADVQYYQYQVGGQSIHVEVTASNVMEPITRLPVHGQVRLFEIIAGLVPEVGDSEILEDDEGRKNRSARVVRLKSKDANTINLLLTR